MNGLTMYSLVPEFSRAYNELIGLFPQVAAHAKKFQFSLSQIHQFLESFSRTATMTPLTQTHLEAYQMILKYKNDLQKLLTENSLQNWAYSVLKQPVNYVPGELCQIALGLQKAAAVFDPEGAKAFDGASPQWVKCHLYDLKAIDASLKQYKATPNADPNVLKLVDNKLVCVNKSIIDCQGKPGQTRVSSPSPIPQLYQSWRLIYSDLEIGDEIGRGTSAFVYLGKLKPTGQQVAIKALRFKKLQGPQLAAFQRELSILASAQHECLLKFFGATDEHPFCIVTEWMPGSTLFEDFQKRHSLNVTDRSIALFDIARGMRYLHSKQIIHRDLKSLNVLIDGEKRVKICDFGMSRFTNEGGAMTNNIGTPHWMAPELFQADGQYDSKVDVYAYAIVLWEICTCKVPYQGIIPAQIIRRVLVNDMRPTVPDNASPELKKLMEKCWSRDPSERPSFSEIVQKIEGGEIYIEGTDKEEFQKYIKTAVDYENVKIEAEFDKIMAEMDLRKLAVFIEEIGIPEGRIEPCLSILGTTQDLNLKVKLLIGFLHTRYVQQATEYIKALPQSSFSKKDIQKINQFFQANGIA